MPIAYITDQSRLCTHSMTVHACVHVYICVNYIIYDCMSMHAYMQAKEAIVFSTEGKGEGRREEGREEKRMVT